MKKRIVILTATRAEYGLLAPIIKKLKREKEIEVCVAVTGTHLSVDFGYTVDEIKKDGIEIDKTIDILLNSDSPVAMSKTMGLALIGFSDYFDECKPDALMVLGDRYETLAVCIAALNAKIPIIHLYGGETTEGVIDESIRNAITKLSYIHFTSTEIYRRHVVQMGESPNRVFAVGAMGVENALCTKTMSKQELEESLGFELGDHFAIMTFHPVTLEDDTAQRQIIEVIAAMKEYPNVVFLCTKANADAGGKIINQCLYDSSHKYKNIFLVDSLGAQRYISALCYADFVIGNSSSGIVEVPCFRIPTINIGDRQKGRIQADSIVNTIPNRRNIMQAIDLANSVEFKKKIANVDNPYGDGTTSSKIVNIVKQYLVKDELQVRKKFYEILD